MKELPFTQKINSTFFLSVSIQISSSLARNHISVRRTNLALHSIPLCSCHAASQEGGLTQCHGSKFRRHTWSTFSLKAKLGLLTPNKAEWKPSPTGALVETSLFASISLKSLTRAVIAVSMNKIVFRWNWLLRKVSLFPAEAWSMQLSSFRGHSHHRSNMWADSWMVGFLSEAPLCNHIFSCRHTKHHARDGDFYFCCHGCFHSTAHWQLLLHEMHMWVQLPGVIF